MNVLSHSEKEQVHLSFRDKLMGPQANHFEKYIDDWASNDEEDELKENEDPCCPKLRLSKVEKGKIGKPWGQT